MSAQPDREAPHVSRSEFRRYQRAWLKKASESRVVYVGNHHVIVDAQYFRGMLKVLEGFEETLEIMQDHRLYNQILRTADALEDGLRAGRLHSLEEAFNG